MCQTDILYLLTTYIKRMQTCIANIQDQRMYPVYLD